MRGLLLLIGAALIGWVSPPLTPMPRTAVASVDTLKLDAHLDTLFGKQSFAFTARTVDSVGRTKNTRITWIVRDSSLFRSLKTTGTWSTHLSAFSKGDTGRTYVVATASTKKDSALVVERDTSCTAGTVASVNVIPDSAVLRYKDTTSAVVIAKDDCGDVIPGGVNVTWATTSAPDATVSSLDSLIGRVLVVDSSGTVYIRGTVGSLKDSMKIKLRGNPGA